MVLKGWAESKRNLETNGPLRVGLETNFAKGKADKYLSNTTNPSVKGKKEVARSRAFKILTKSDTVRAGKQLLNTTTTWSVRSTNGDGSSSQEPFQFKADDRAILDLRRLGCGDQGSGISDKQSGDGGQRMETDLIDGGVRLGNGDNGSGTLEKHSGDGGQSMEADLIVDPSGQRSASKGEVPARMDDDQHGDISGQATVRAQRLSYGKESEFGNVLAFNDPVSVKGQDQSNADDDGMEFEEESGGFVDSC